MSGGIYFLGNLIFIIFGSGETQQWDEYESTERNNEGTIMNHRSTSAGDDTVIS